MISAFVIHFLELSYQNLLHIETSFFWLASVAEETCFSLAMSEDRFCHVQAYSTCIMYHNWKIGPFRNRENLQSSKTSDLVSLFLSFRNTITLTLPSID